MPAIPGTSGQQATHDRSVFGGDQLHVGQQEHSEVDAAGQGQGFRQLQADSIALDNSRQMNVISTSPHMAQGLDPRRAWQGRGSHFDMPLTALVQATRLGRADTPSRHGEATPHTVPQWTNNRC